MNTPLSTASLAIPYDALAYTKGSEQFKAWKTWALQPAIINELETFVTETMTNRGSATYIDTAEGSFNIILRFNFDTGNDVALRFPKPGHTVSDLMTEKVANEVAWMQFLTSKTSIPIPRIYDFSSKTPNHLPSLNLPFILMDFIEGRNLRDFMAELSPLGRNTASDAKRSTILAQVANFYIQLSNLSFDSIGSIARDPASDQWAILKRPLTMDMHELVLGIPDYSVADWPSGPLQDSADYLRFVVSQQREQLWSLRNLNMPHEHGHDDINLEQVAHIAKLRFMALKGFEKLIPHFNSTDDGHFIPFMPDLDTRNMLVDPSTCHITGLIDFEFTNTMPSSLSHDPPLWLYRVLPGSCLDNDFFPWFLREYEPYLNHFLDIMRRAETIMPWKGEKPLSALMLESWTSQHCWFNFAVHRIGYVDSIYWAVLHRLHPEGDGSLTLSPEDESEMRTYVDHTKKLYEEEWRSLIDTL
ncbi:hypothetical protein FSARC_7936 [Fusarium sarcochroum]|uniref:Aminoglycoside phosphotransferase domain-containing protein n=1 Tax=Fusarium sarcochroum TaxID=1208366 RepID=A0A8H4TU66_9HYPO|nr:hypothetical protein FSARC_7936 [Fusarium sarcochroum]